MFTAARCLIPNCRVSDMATPLRPASAEDLRDIVADAIRSARAIEVVSGGSKRPIGRPGRPVDPVDLGALAGVIDYVPNELVLTARPATPLAEIDALLARNGQMLAFEPWDHACLFGSTAPAATIGGIVAAGVAGSRRVSAGGARDHLLGFEAVSGRGEIFRAGGKVVKNVTGFDLSKAIAGSWGQLAIMTELTVKVLPRPKCMVTLALHGLDVQRAIQAMAAGLGSRNTVAAAAYAPATGERPSRTAMRLEGFAESVAARAAALAGELVDIGAMRELSASEADDFWRSVTTAALLADSEALWRVHVAPSQASGLAREVEAAGARYLIDWAGAALWVGASAACDVRRMARASKGHAMLVRAPEELRLRVSARQVGTSAISALEARLRQAFDPAGILDPDRFS